nr:MAG TPA: hypothetical protein [Caudoviricetes sp.]
MLRPSVCGLASFGQGLVFLLHSSEVPVRLLQCPFKSNFEF